MAKSIKAQVYEVQYINGEGVEQKCEIYVPDKKIDKKDESRIIRKIKKFVKSEDYSGELSEELVRKEVSRFKTESNPDSKISEIKNVKWVRTDRIGEF